MHIVQVRTLHVASFAEAWIEITAQILDVIDMFVASFAEAWIEIRCCTDSVFIDYCRLLRGGVD